jgi:hypothetical protein
MVQLTVAAVAAAKEMVVTCPCTTFYPTFSVSPGAYSCVGQTVTYTTQSGQSSYTWTISGTSGVNYTKISGGTSTSNTLVLKWLTGGGVTRTVSVDYKLGSTCTSSGAATSATIVYDVPTITVTSNQRCGSGSVALTATPSAGTAYWYTTSTGGTSVNSGNTYNPTLSSTTSYYVEANNNGCVSTTRATSTATINPVASISSVTIPTVCSGTSHSYTPIDGTDGTVPSGTTYSWSAPTGSSYITGGATGSNASSISGTLTNTTTTAQTVYYIVSPKTGTCTGSSFTAGITIKPIPTVTVANGNTCPNGTVTFSAVSNVSGSSFNWYQTSSSSSILGTNAIYTTPALTSSTDYYVEALANGCSSGRIKATANVSNADTTTWTGAYSNDWTNSLNWSNGVPCSVTNVVVPNVATSGVAYPTISSGVSCKTITFKPGGAVLGLQYLTYEKAIIKTQLQREKWYTLTAPLKQMYAGDYAFSGSPVAQMRLFDQINPDSLSNGVTYVGTWTRGFSNPAVALTPGSGFAYLVNQKTYNYPGAITFVTSDIQITFPRTNTDGSLMTQYYPYSTYSGALLSPPWTVTKDANYAYRFAAENASNLISDVSYSLKQGLNLIGNPLMTHLDFNKLYAHNSSVISNNVKFWNGTTFTSYIAGSTLNASVSSASNVTNIIPPMQSFFVVAYNNSTTLTVDIDNDYVANNSMNLRSASSTQPEILYVESSNGSYQSTSSICHKNGADNSYDNNDAFKLFTQIKHVPEVYTIAGDVALDINQFQDYPYTTPLCFKTDSGTVNLTFNGLDNFDSDVIIELINTKTGETQDLREASTYTYTVEPNKDEGSLYLSLRSASTVTLNQTIGRDHDIQIFATDDSKIRVISAPADPIKNISIFSTSGRIIQQCCVKNTSTMELPVYSKNEVYIVQVVTQNNTRIAKVLVK